MPIHVCARYDYSPQHPAVGPPKPPAGVVGICSYMKKAAEWPFPAPPLPSNVPFQNPMLADCLPGERPETVDGVDGMWCAPPCSASELCPAGMPFTADGEPVIRVWPECVITTSNKTVPNKCAMVCVPSCVVTSSGAASPTGCTPANPKTTVMSVCPAGASCKAIGELVGAAGICTYDVSGNARKSALVPANAGGGGGGGGGGADGNSVVIGPALAPLQQHDQHRYQRHTAAAVRTAATPRAAVPPPPSPMPPRLPVGDGLVGCPAPPGPQRSYGDPNWYPTCMPGEEVLTLTDGIHTTCSTPCANLGEGACPSDTPANTIPPGGMLQVSWMDVRTGETRCHCIVVCSPGEAGAPAYIRDGCPPGAVRNTIPPAFS